jgi:hypothetical protein
MTVPLPTYSDGQLAVMPLAPEPHQRPNDMSAASLPKQ